MEKIYHRKDGLGKVTTVRFAKDVETGEDIVVYKDPQNDVYVQKKGLLRCATLTEFLSVYQELEPPKAFFKSRSELDLLWDIEHFKPDFTRVPAPYNWERNIKKGLKSWTILPQDIILYRTLHSIYAVVEIKSLGLSYYWITRFAMEEKTRRRLSSFSPTCSVGKLWLKEKAQQELHLPLLPP